MLNIISFIASTAMPIVTHTPLQNTKVGLSYDSVLGVLERRIAPAVDWSRFSQLGTLGLEEIASQKGQGH